jgi:hypothetical protein
MSKTDFFSQPTEGQSPRPSHKPVDWDGALKNLKPVSIYCPEKKIIIHDSKIAVTRQYGSCNIGADLSETLGKGVSMAFYWSYARLSEIKGNEDVVIYEEPKNRRLIFSTTGIKVPLSIPSATMPVGKLVEFPKDEQLGTEVYILNESFPSIRKSVKKEEFVDLFVAGGQLDRFCLRSGQTHPFDAAAGEKEPELILRSRHFLAIRGKEAVIRLYKKDGRYWLVTKTTLGEKMEVTFQEKLRLKK